MVYEIYILGAVGGYEDQLWALGFSQLEKHWHYKAYEGEVAKITNELNDLGLYYVIDRHDENEKPQLKRWWLREYYPYKH